jgi:hypothetical protein
LFDYDDINWTTGNASGGKGGLGGELTRIGVSNGQGSTIELPASGIQGQILDLENAPNSGQFIIRVRNGLVYDADGRLGTGSPRVPPPPPPPPSRGSP